MKKVFIGLSGGVDSSVSAYLLKKQGYKVVGVYMKNWSQDLPGFECPWFEDYQDSKRVAVQLGIEFKMFDFETDYKHLVVDYMIDEYKKGRTPNPDIMCNQEIKFRLFLNACLEDGADLISTGHYAKTKDGKLLVAKDEAKDQTYFLYRISKEALQKTLFPLGDLKKPEVRKIAKEQKLVTATKKESMGVCFVGKVGIKDFLSHYVKTKPGKIINQDNQVVGEHEGAIFYTIGQRHGLNTGGGKPYYVTGKNMRTNMVYVTTKLDDKKLWTSQIDLINIHWISREPKKNEVLLVRLRHQGPLLRVKSLKALKNTVTILLDHEERAVTAGQSAVIYSGSEVLGGGVVV
ncbi:MAG: tRNA 2-thiouridine(34) synthase MnmA [Patescibacteria group bacterium]